MTSLLSSIPQPQPSTPMSRLPVSSSNVLDTLELDTQVAQVAALQARVQHLETEVENAKAHCAMALHEMGLMNKRLNKKKTRSRARNFQARWLTSADGLRECELQDAARAEKKKKQAEVVAWKAAKQADRVTRQAAQGSAGFRFSGLLSAKAKEDLVDVATYLKIDATGTKADLLASASWLVT